MIANPTTINKSILCEPLNVPEMVEEIQACYEKLDPCRRYLFIEWLQSHSSQVKAAADVSEGLTAWLESVQYENLQWEFRLIKGEIDWWSRLDEKSLTRIMLSDLVRND